MHCSLITLTIAASFFTISNGSAMQDENNAQKKPQNKLLAKTHESLSQNDDEMDKALRAAIKRNQTAKGLKSTAFVNPLNNKPSPERKLVNAIRTNPKLRAEIVRFLADQ